MVHAIREQIPGGQPGLLRKIDKIRELVHAAKRDPAFREATVGVVRKVRERDWSGEIGAITRFVRDRVRFTQDPYDSDGLELFVDPRLLIQQALGGTAAEDCDGHVLLASAMLETIGHPTRYRVGGAAKHRYAHIWLDVLHPKRGWVPIELTRKNAAIGWDPSSRFPHTETYPSEAATMGQLGALYFNVPSRANYGFYGMDVSGLGAADLAGFSRYLKPKRLLKYATAGLTDSKFRKKYGKYILGGAAAVAVPFVFPALLPAIGGGASSLFGGLFGAGGAAGAGSIFGGSEALFGGAAGAGGGGFMAGAGGFLSKLLPGILPGLMGGGRQMQQPALGARPMMMGQSVLPAGATSYGAQFNQAMARAGLVPGGLPQLQIPQQLMPAGFDAQSFMQNLQRYYAQAQQYLPQAQKIGAQIEKFTDTNPFRFLDRFGVRGLGWLPRDSRMAEYPGKTYEEAWRWIHKTWFPMIAAEAKKQGIWSPPPFNVWRTERLRTMPDVLADYPARAGEPEGGESAFVRDWGVHNLELHPAYMLALVTWTLEKNPEFKSQPPTGTYQTSFGLRAKWLLKRMTQAHEALWNLSHQNKAAAAQKKIEDAAAAARKKEVDAANELRRKALEEAEKERKRLEGLTEIEKAKEQAKDAEEQRRLEAEQLKKELAHKKEMDRLARSGATAAELEQERERRRQELVFYGPQLPSRPPIYGPPVAPPAPPAAPAISPTMMMAGGGLLLLVLMMGRK